MPDYGENCYLVREGEWLAGENCYLPQEEGEPWPGMDDCLLPDC